MIRLGLLWSLIVFLGVYAWKDWFKALCGLIFLMAFIEHPDMPKTIFGIQGLNPWNILLLVILLAWSIDDKGLRLGWDMPRRYNVLLLLFGLVILIGFVRLVESAESMERLEEFAALYNIRVPTIGSMASEQLLNTLKWIFPGFLLFQGCRSRERLMWALCAVLAVYFVLALQTIKWMPLSSIGGADSLASRSGRVLAREIGYHRVDLSVMLAGASWAIFATRALAQRWIVSAGLALASGLVLLGQALTAGRAGYLAWVAVGLVLCWVRWRKLLLLVPVAVLSVILFVPGMKDRVTEGFSAKDGFVYGDGSRGDGENDLVTISAGRSVIWPLVIGEIRERPLFGHGRQAMVTTGLTAYILREYHDTFPHPHNAYLELFLDNGFVGALPVLIFFLLVTKTGISLFGDMRRREFVAVGGVGLSLVLAHLLASFSAQSFYPREDTVGMWCAIGLMLRVAVERARWVGGALWERTAQPTGNSTEDFGGASAGMNTL